MQFLKIDSSTTLSKLADLVGDRNVESVLAANNLTRSPNIGKQLASVTKAAADAVIGAVDAQRKMTVLNTLTGDSDVFETAALLSESNWKVLSSTGNLPNTLKIPETITLADSVDVLGDGLGVSSTIYKKVMNSLKNAPHTIDPAIFNTYSSTKQTQLIERTGTASSDPFQWFNLPWGKISLYSSLVNDKMDFPVYPEEVSDGVSANYTQMPDMLYQYEPWQVYQSSGPRSNTYTFKFHRDMWSGDHTDGKANQLIRFCEANCYPEYNGSAVNTPTVTLYIGGQAHITGVMTECRPKWSGPIGQDGWYLMCELELGITEVSETPLSYSTVMNKGLIG